jgi:hypothetical protein
VSSDKEESFNFITFNYLVNIVKKPMTLITSRKTASTMRAKRMKNEKNPTINVSAYLG